VQKNFFLSLPVKQKPDPKYEIKKRRKIVPVSVPVFFHRFFFTFLQTFYFSPKGS